MKAQTGKEPGGPTGLCHKLVLAALTGHDIDFQKFLTMHEIKGLKL